MLLHITGDPTVKIGDERIVVSFPSGADGAHVALTLNQALQLEHRTRQAIIRAYEPGFFASREAAEEIRCELLAFPKHPVA